MSLASNTILLILLVIPGFATLFGFYVGSRLSGQLRDVTPKSQAGEIAMVVLLALTMHALSAALLLAGVRGAALLGVAAPGLGLGPFFDVLGTDCASLSSACRPTLLLAEHAPAIFGLTGYVALTTALGFILGRVVIFLIETKRIGIKRFHSWTYDFVVGRDRPIVMVTVLTDIVQHGIHVGYRGILDQMNLDSDQNIRAVLLQGACKVFMPLHTVPPTTGACRPFVPVNADAMPVTGETHGLSYHLQGGEIHKLVIPGARILNLAMEPREIETDAAALAALDASLDDLPALPN